MRWTLRISFLLLLAWAIFVVSPFVALYDLSKAVEAKDLARIEARVNFNALRVSLTRQLLGDYLEQKNLGGLNRQLAADAGAAVLNPIVENLVTPQAVIDLLEDGWPQQAAGSGNGSLSPIRLDLGSLREAWQVFISSESQGFRSITIPLPAGEAKEKQFRIVMRLRGTTWRLSGLELPDALRENLMKRAAVAMKSNEIK
jgi:hypothetical protein